MNVPPPHIASRRFRLVLPPAGIRGCHRDWNAVGRRIVLAAFSALLLAGCIAPARPTAPSSTAPLAPAEPPNLGLLKQELVAYAESGAYARGLAAVAAEARTWIEQRAARATDDERGRLAVVLDLDETLLSNLSHIRAQDFGYLPPVWSAWVAKAAAPAIEPVAEVYRAARRRGVAVFYITGRRESDRPGTERNLQALGLDGHAALHCKPDEFHGTSQAFKTAVRRRLTQEGYIIIANIGDQESDLAGGYAERTFKLPNPFYLTK